jgi:outer membrane protein OmpA-like peptidoglycan-associated protein
MISRRVFRSVAVVAVAALVVGACGGSDSTTNDTTSAESSPTTAKMRTKNAALSACPSSVAGVVTWAADVAGAPGTCTGTFIANATWTPAAGVSSVTYLVVGGGGGGYQANTQASKLGGSGGQVKTGSVAIGAGDVTVVVGAGGNGGANGNDSSFSQGGVAVVTASKGLTNAGPNGAGVNGTTSSITGTVVIYGSSGGKGGGFAGGSGAGSGAVISGLCGGGSHGVANRGGGGGGGAYGVVSGDGFSFPCYTVGGSGGSGIVVVQYNAFGVTSFATTAATPTQSTNPIDWTLTFSAAIDPATLTAADISNAGTSDGCVFSITSVSTSSFTVTASSCGEGTVTPRLAASSIAPASGGTGPGANADGNTVTIDRTPPSAPSAVDLAAASDTGSSNTDNVTKDNTPTMSATPAGAVDGDRITMTASKEGSAPVSCSYVLPATSCDLGTLSDGSWAVSAKHTDGAGNESAASAPMNLAVDTSANAGTPDLVADSDTGSSSTDNLTKDTTPAITAGDNVADGDTVTVSASKAGQTTKTCTYVKSPTVNSCDVGPLSEGAWDISTAATDPAGNTAGPTGGLSLNIDGTAPSAPAAPDLLPASDSGASNTDNKTSDTTPSMSGGTVPDGSSVTTSGRKADGSTVSCTYVASPTVNSCDLPTMSDGRWSMSSTVTDPAGNTSPSGPALDVDIDSTAPAAPTGVDLLASSDTGSSSTDNVTNDDTPAVSATPVDAVNGEAVTLTATKAGSTPVSCSYVLPATSCDLGALADGTWNVSARHTDLAGNQSAASPALPLTVDTSAAPGTPDLVTASDTGRLTNDNVTNDSTPAISADGEENGDTVTVSARKSDGTTATCSYVKSATVNSCDLPTLSDGDWRITTSKVDSAGNASPASVPLDITVDTAAPAAPGAPDLLPASDSGTSNTDNLTNDTTPSMSGGNVPDGSSVTITGRKADGSTVSCTYVASSTVNSCDMPTMSDGPWSMSSTVTDPAGNASPAGPALDVTIDSLAPLAGPSAAAISAPDLLAASDSGTSNSDNLTNDNTPAVSMPGASTGETVALTARKADGTTVTCSYVVSATVNSCDLPTMSDGAWKLTGTITDAAGNTSAVSPALDLNIDTTPPTAAAPDLLPASDTGASKTDNITNDTTPAVSLPGAVDGEEVTMTAKKTDGTSVSCTYVKSPTVSSCNLETLTDGNWAVDATVKDQAGNTSAAGPSLGLTINTKKPATPTKPVIPTTPSGEISDPTPNIEIPGIANGDTATATAKKGGDSVECVFVGAPGVRSCDLPLLTPGQWFVSAKVTDPAGNTSSETEAVPMTVVDPGLPANAISTNTLSTVNVDGTTTATAKLKPSEVGQVANVVFVVRNADGSIAKTSRVAASTQSATVTTKIAGLGKGQRVEAYTENWLGVSRNAPVGSNVIRAATSRAVDKLGKPKLIGSNLGVSRIIFDPASPLLDSGDRAQLDRIVAQLTGKGGLVLISGFARQNLTDSRGFLSNLSVERAKAVAMYLSGRGVRAWIRYQGYGAVTREMGTYEDRKVEIRWVSGATELPKR